MTTAHDWSLLRQLLQREGATAAQLLDVLKDEREALETRDYPRFEALLPSKKNLIETLERSLAVRRQHLHQMGFATDADALAMARKRLPPVAESWESAADRWRECQHANLVNDQISRRTRLIVEQVLDALRGQHNQSTTYDASGTSQRGSGGRTISSA